MDFNRRIAVFLPVVSYPGGVPILGLFVYEKSRVVMLKNKLPDLKLSDGNIGQRISIFRKKLKLTQKELSDKIGIERTHISDYECGRIRLYDEMVIRIALALGVSSDELLGIKENDIPFYTDIDSIDIRWIKKITELKKIPESKQKEIIRHINTVLENYQLKNNINP